LPSDRLNAPPRPRLGHLDWLRGLAVLIMIEAHTLDSWTRSPDRETTFFGWLTIFNGFGSALFLFLAGVAVGLGVAAKARRLGSVAAGVAAVQRRGLEILVLGLLFRAQAYLLNPAAAPISILKVDILNVMGPSIIVAATLWRFPSTTAGRLATYGAATVALAMSTPLIRSAAWLNPLPDPLEWYLRPSPGHTVFVIFPWAAFVFGGAAIGVLIDAWRQRADTDRLYAGLAVSGLALAIVSYAASFGPALYDQVNFWTSSPTFLFLRLGVLIAVLAPAYAWERIAGSTGWSPLQQFGRTSLFVYWIHIEMVYGWISAPIHRKLSLPQAVLGYVLFTLFLFGVSLFKTWVVQQFERWRKGARQGAAPAVF
jgi:uncharacterized membrane protein